jgi:hypothetical protein
MDVSGQPHAPAALPPEKTPDAHWIEGWVDPRAGLDTAVKRKIPSRCQDSNPDHTAHLRVFIYFLILSRKCQNINVKQPTTTSFQILAHEPFKNVFTPNFMLYNFCR